MGLTRIRILTGGFGCGKTEIAVNLALESAAGGYRTALCDLDIVNPYFRSGTRRGLLEDAGVDVIATGIDGKIDLPSVPAEFTRVFSGVYDRVILDVGGNHSGAAVLGAYRDRFAALGEKPECLLVVNARRPFSAAARDITGMCRAIEARSGVTVSALVNNTNLALETTPDVLREGQIVADEAARMLGIRAEYLSGLPEILERVPDPPGISRKRIPLKLYLRPSWLDDDLKNCS